jgi:hypothetical protein
MDDGRSGVQRRPVRAQREEHEDRSGRRSEQVHDTGLADARVDEPVGRNVIAAEQCRQRRDFPNHLTQSESLCQCTATN